MPRIAGRSKKPGLKVGNVRGCSGEMLVQLAPDFLLDHALEGGKQHAELCAHLDFIGTYGDLAADAGAFETQRRIVLPLRLDLEFLPHTRGDLVDHGVRFGGGQTVWAADID